MRNRENASVYHLFSRGPRTTSPSPTSGCNRRSATARALGVPQLASGVSTTWSCERYRRRKIPYPTAQTSVVFPATAFADCNWWLSTGSASLIPAAKGTSSMMVRPVTT